MPAPFYKYGKQGKSYKNGRNLFSLFYIKIMHVWLSPPPTMHTKIASIFTAYTGRLRNAREMRGDYGITFLKINLVVREK